MCTLIVLRGLDVGYPVVAAANRDEDRSRKASPPGLYVGERHRILCPRDRRAGGTWLGVGDQGMLAGLTNLVGAPAPAGAPTRGRLPLLALDQDGVEAAAERVCEEVAARPYAGFQLVLADAERLVVLIHTGGRLECEELDEVCVVSNVHRPGELRLEGLEAARVRGLAVTDRLERLRPLLLDRGEGGRHPVLAKGERYGTVSSSLIAVPAADLSRLVWLYAAGPPDEAPYRNYGNLGKRLIRG